MRMTDFVFFIIYMVLIGVCIEQGERGGTAFFLGVAVWKLVDAFVIAWKEK